MKCYVINLDRSPLRLTGMRDLFRAAGIPFERFTAVDGDRLPAEEIEALTFRRLDYRALTPSEVGCFLSHHRCWERIAAGSDNFAAIFEDDVDFSRNGTACLKDATWIPSDADLVKLEAYDQKVCVDRRALPTPGNYSVTRLWSKHWGTAGYVVSRAFAARLANNTRQFSVTVDDAMFNPRYAAVSEAVVYQIVPALCIQRQFNTESDPLQAYRSTVTSSARSPEFQIPAQPRLMRETSRIKAQMVRFIRRRMMLRVPFQPAGDSN